MADPEGQMALLRERFHARANTDRAAILMALDAGDRAALLRLAHGLAGVAGIFGYADVSAKAAAVEEAVEVGETGDALMRKGVALIAALEAVGGAAEV